MKFQATLVLVALIGFTSAQYMDGLRRGFNGFHDGMQNGLQSGLNNGLRAGFRNGVSGGFQGGMNAFRNGMQGGGSLNGNTNQGMFFGRTMNAMTGLKTAIGNDLTNYSKKLSDLNLSGRAKRQAEDLMQSMMKIQTALGRMVSNMEPTAMIDVFSEVAGILPNMFANMLSLAEAKVRMGFLLPETLRASINIGTSMMSDMTSMMNPVTFFRSVVPSIPGLSTLANAFGFNSLVGGSSNGGSSNGMGDAFGGLLGGAARAAHGGLSGGLTGGPPGALAGALAGGLNSGSSNGMGGEVGRYLGDSARSIQGYGLGSILTGGLSGVVDSAGNALDGLLEAENPKGQPGRRIDRLRL